MEIIPYLIWALFGFVMGVMSMMVILPPKQSKQEPPKVIPVVHVEKVPVKVPKKRGSGNMEALKAANERRRKEAHDRITSHLKMFIDVHHRYPSVHELTIVAEADDRTARRVLEQYKQKFGHLEI